MADVVARPDRRAALKERHRRAILAAAAELMQETGGIGFSVDTLAERADVSRRTVFNHFASLEDVAITVASDVLTGVVDTFVTNVVAGPADDDSPAALFEEIAHALRTTELVAPMAYLTRSLGMDLESPMAATIMLRAFSQVSGRFCAAMNERHPGADELAVELLVNMLMSGVVVLYQHWALATGATDTPRARRLWAELIDRLLSRVAAGFSASAQP